MLSGSGFPKYCNTTRNSTWFSKIFVALRIFLHFWSWLGPTVAFYSVKTSVMDSKLLEMMILLQLKLHYFSSNILLYTSECMYVCSLDLLVLWALEHTISVLLMWCKHIGYYYLLLSDTFLQECLIWQPHVYFYSSKLSSSI